MTEVEKPRSAKRTKWLKLRVSEDDLVVLKSLVDAAGLNTSSFMRGQLFGTTAQLIKRAQPMPAIIADLIEQLALIGNNLNQIARKLNSGDGVDNRALTLCIEQLRKALLAVKS